MNENRRFCGLTSPPQVQQPDITFVGLRYKIDKLTVVRNANANDLGAFGSPKLPQTFTSYVTDVKALREDG